jgi:TolB-like protein/DNA-binding winged helix-turn-helix (wHTH) protein/Tfp pilus assembly protein PilF
MSQSQLGVSYCPLLPGCCAVLGDVLRFGEGFELDRSAYELRRSGCALKLERIPMEILLLLVQRRGQLVSREDIIEKVWGKGVFLDTDNSINAAIWKIRQILRDDSEKPVFVQTVTGKGYRFIAPVAALSAPVVPPRSSVDASEPKSALVEPALVVPHGRIGKKIAGAGIGDVVAASGYTAAEKRGSRLWRGSLLTMALLAASLFLAPNFGDYVRTLFRAKGTQASSSRSIRSLAVIPLENLSDNKNDDYFADGMTDELITDLGQRGSLRVISRTSIMQYKGVHKSLPQIARELDVDAVVEGTVLKSGNNIRITAQLIEAATDKHLWAQTYNGSFRDVVALQNEVARAIADQVRIKLTSQQEALLRREQAVDPEAYEDYLKGRYLWNRRTSGDLQKAITYFERAIARDPKYALAYSGLAQSYVLLAGYELPERDSVASAEAAANKALELDPNLAEPQATLGLIAENHRWEFAEAERRYKLVTELHPNYATGHHWLGEAYLVAGRFSEAQEEFKQAHQLDPLSLMISADAGSAFCFARQYDLCLDELGHTLDLDPNFTGAHAWRALAFEGKAMFPQAIVETQAVREGDDTPRTLALLAHAYAQSGDRLDAQKLLRELRRRSAREYVNPWDFALIYAGLGDKEAAFSWLEKSYQARSPELINLKIDLRFDLLRSDQRFQDLMRRIGLPV